MAGSKSGKIVADKSTDEWRTTTDQLQEEVSTVVRNNVEMQIQLQNQQEHWQLDQQQKQQQWQAQLQIQVQTQMQEYLNRLFQQHIQMLEKKMEDTEKRMVETVRSEIQKGRDEGKSKHEPITQGSKKEEEKGEASPFSVSSNYNGKPDKAQWFRNDCPNFDGTKVEEWIARSNYYFEMCNTPATQKMIQAVANFTGEANEWYRGYKNKNDHPSWEKLVALIKRRFNESLGLNAFEELRQLYQIGTVREYMQKFEKVQSRMEIESLQWPESEFLRAFISGLRDDVKPLVNVMKPKDVLEAFELAKHMELSIENQWKRQKGQFKSNFMSSNQTQRGMSNREKPQDQKSINSNSNSKNEVWEQRRALGLCFKCGDKYYPGHQCKVKINMLIGQNAEGSEEEDELQGEINAKAV